MPGGVSFQKAAGLVIGGGTAYEGLGASELFDYHAADWVQQVRAAVPGGVDLLLDGADGQTRDQAVGAVRDGGRAIFLVLAGPPAQLERGIAGESFAAHVNRQRLEALRRLVDAGQLRPQVEAVLPLEQVREALARVGSDVLLEESSLVVEAEDVHEVHYDTSTGGVEAPGG